jgi:hypothetical protein
VPRGVSVKTPERVVEAQRLHADGWTLAEIAELWNVSATTVHGWIRDPDLSRQRARRDSYRVPCPECGRPMSGEGETCGACRKTWTRDAVVAAIRDWADEHDGVPPTSTEFNPPVGSPARVERESGRWPARSTVLAAFGSWNAAMLAAGFQPRHGATRHAGRAGLSPP